MNDRIEQYETTIKKINDVLDSISKSLSENSSAANYTITTFFSQKKNAFFVVAVNNTDGTYARIYKHPNAFKISCFSSTQEKQCEFYKEIKESQSKKTKFSFLFIGPDSTDSKKYLMDKVGIYEKSIYVPERNYFTPLEISENYYTPEQKLVTMKLSKIKPNLKIQDFSDELSLILSSIDGKFESNDRGRMALIRSSTQEQLGCHLKSQFELYALLHSVDIPTHLNKLFNVLRKELDDYKKNNSVSESNPKSTENEEPTGSEDKFEER